jgi:membrane-associated phospholipid phosphatase
VIADRTAVLRFFLHALLIFLGLGVLTTALGIAIRAWAPGFDTQTMQALATQSNSTLLRLAGIVSDAGSFALLAPLSIALLLLRRWKRPADDLALIVIAAGCAALPSVIKLIVDRPRPEFGNVTHLLTLSFPSEHSTQAAGIYLTIAILLSQGLRRGWREAVIVLAVLIALAVAWSRVYLGVHYPTDVTAGLALGWSWALLVFHWARPGLTRSVAETVTAPNSAATS